MIRRREFIAGLRSAAVWPVVARAQQGERMRRVGVLTGFEENDAKTYVSAFIQALAGFGWIDGRNVRIDNRWASSDTNRMQALAKELVGSQPDVIVTSSTPATAAVQRETRTIPTVFAGVGDPVASGIVTRLDRPSGNITARCVAVAPWWSSKLLNAPPIARRSRIPHDRHQPLASNLNRPCAIMRTGQCNFGFQGSFC
jgi:ABC-type uncharacterized transport system substrate-binding protein